jgi:hypothetical protein
MSTDADRCLASAVWLRERIEDLRAPDLFLDEEDYGFEREIVATVGAARVLLEHARERMVSLAEHREGRAER